MSTEHDDVLYLLEQLEQRQSRPGDDLMSALLHTEIDGEPVDDLTIMAWQL